MRKSYHRRNHYNTGGNEGPRIPWKQKKTDFPGGDEVQCDTGETSRGMRPQSKAFGLSRKMSSVTFQRPTGNSAGTAAENASRVPRPPDAAGSPAGRTSHNIRLVTEPRAAVFWTKTCHFLLTLPVYSADPQKLNTKLMLTNS